MASFEFNPIADFVVLRFKCPECGHDNETDALYVPCQILQQRTIAIVVIAKITSMNVLIVDTCLK